MSIKNKILNSLKEIQIPHLKSLSIIGSFNYAKKLESIEDIDIYLIVDKLDATIYQDIVSEFTILTRNLTNEKYLFISEFRAGPIKPAAKTGKKVLQLHVLINKIVDIEDKSPLVALDWKLNSFTLQGDPVRKYIQVSRFSAADLINGKDGLLFVLQLLEKSEVAYKERFINAHGQLEKRNITKKLDTNEEKFQFLQAHILTAALNFIRLKNPNMKKDYSLMLSILKNELPGDQVLFLEQIINMKKRYKTGSKVSFDFERMKSDSKRFISTLIDIAKSKS